MRGTLLISSKTCNPLHHIDRQNIGHKGYAQLRNGGHGTPPLQQVHGFLHQADARHSEFGRLVFSIISFDSATTEVIIAGKNKRGYDPRLTD
jgi:hypothetical protein